MVNLMRNADWLVDTTWYHVASTNQSALLIHFIKATRGKTRKCPEVAWFQLPRHITLQQSNKKDNENLERKKDVE